MLLARAVFEMHGHFGKRAQVALEGGGEFVEPDTIHRPDPHGAGHGARKGLQVILNFPVPLHDLFTHLVQHFARLRETRVSLGTLNQLTTVAIFKAADLLTHRGLRDEIFRRR